MPKDKTGFEQKTLRAVIEAFLWTSDVELMTDASCELRRRLAKTFPCPDWFKENKERYK